MAYQDQTLAPTLLATTYSLLSLSFVVISLRWFHQLCMLRKRLRSFDYLMGIAFTCELVSAAIRTKAVHMGYGHHLSTLDYKQIGEISKWMFFNQPPAVFSSAFGRVAFALYLIEIVGLTSRFQRRLLQIVIVEQSVFTTFTMLQVILQCGSHVDAAWGATDPNAHCQPAMVQTVIGYVLSGFNSASDLVLTFVPLMVIRQLRMSLRVKVGLFGLLCLSLLALVASLVKLYQVKVLESTSDFTWSLVYLNICGTIENDMVMIGATIPMLKPLFTKPRSGLTSSERQSQAASKTKSSTGRAVTQDNTLEKGLNYQANITVKVETV